MDRLMEAIAELERAFATSEYKSVKIELCHTAKTCEVVGRDGEAIKSPMTNRQWLESLSDEKLAWLLDWRCILDIYQLYCEDAHKCVKEWLRAEHKE